MCGRAVMGEHGVQEGVENATLCCPCAKYQHGRGVVAYFHHLGMVRQDFWTQFLLNLLETKREVREMKNLISFWWRGRLNELMFFCDHQL